MQISFSFYADFIVDLKMTAPYNIVVLYKYFKRNEDIDYVDSRSLAGL